MSEKLRRRWFRFSLRTMFVVVTVFCCWLGWESSAVRERRAVLKGLQTNAAFQITTADAWAERFPAGSPVQSGARVPMVRVWLGDEAIQEIWYTRHIQGFSETEISRLTKTFPEAELREALPEPCHPGCFPRGTLVDTPRGRRPIESIQPGESISIILSSGETATAKVQSVFVTDNRLWQVDTEEGVLFTTETQPLCLTAETTLAAGKLRPGDRVLRRQDGEVHSVEMLKVSPTDRTERVFNLILGDTQVFIAGGFLARSKPPAEAAPDRLD